ncbi:hypothetical protein [Commensalibacter papalotli (ex Botero et al. 2024)]|uniref:Sel1 repeat family protein n=1 Tax=Commensalibacter papalotli (ex Botero et al. 2024) TaxID=2972766 RepID=A0ABM9HJ05_9PROT|nr:hypothetical protein [Commensalibacter papalotli (ex Botero et al. 2024)]CAI3925387.1 unnamed protein product [Commensalibacter papalotli (ex Botero et al. 2024)]CAI3926711.1 unnamed protein product [Commensalibacter papalotli (ex Botero et al. 2024)]
MSSQLKVSASAPGEATIILVGKALHYGDVLTISFPQFSSISSQKVIQQSVVGDDLLLIIDADSLGDILEPDSPYQIKVPELEITSTVIWPEIVGKRGASTGVINTTKASSPSKVKTPIIEEEQPASLSFETEPQTSSLPSSLIEDTHGEQKTDYFTQIQNKDDKEEDAPLVSEPSKRHQSSVPIILLSILGVCLLLAGGAIAYIKFSKPHSEPTKEQIVKKEEPKKELPKAAETKPPAPVQPPKAEPSFAENLQKMSVPEVIDKAPNTVMITQEGKRRLEAKQFDDGILLLENAAAKGDTLAMLKLGLLYSPVDFKTGGAIPSPDMREAARYLQKAEEGGLKDATAPRAALKDWLIKKADEGDDMARLTLKDFWK